MTKEKLAKAIEEAVGWLVSEECGCSTIKLDSSLAVCVGWSNGFDVNDTTVIHSKEAPTWAICVGIKVWTSDSMRTDFDWINSPYVEDGEVLNNDCSIAPNEDCNKLAEWLLAEYKALSELELESDGRILNSEVLLCCNNGEKT